MDPEGEDCEEVPSRAHVQAANEARRAAPAAAPASAPAHPQAGENFSMLAMWKGKEAEDAKMKAAALQAAEERLQVGPPAAQHMPVVGSGHG
jgi:hypothetical protein